MDTTAVIPLHFSMLAKTPSDKYSATRAAVLGFPQVGCAAPYPLSAPPAARARQQQLLDGGPSAGCLAESSDAPAGVAVTHMGCRLETLSSKISIFR